jgi:hypothetical protein
MFVTTVLTLAAALAPAALAHPHAHAAAHAHVAERSALQGRWWHEAAHPAHNLFRRDAASPTVGSAGECVAWERTHKRALKASCRSMGCVLPAVDAVVDAPGMDGRAQQRRRRQRHPEHPQDHGRPRSRSDLPGKHKPDGPEHLLFHPEVQNCQSWCCFMPVIAAETLYFTAR